MADEQLDTIADYFEAIRQMLQDAVVPYRYADTDILVGFNMMLLEARRLRPDLFITRWGNTVPRYTVVDSEPVPIEAQFRLGLVLGAAAYVYMFDAEDVNDARANSFMNYFHNILTGVQASSSPAVPVQGGTPAAGSPQK